MMFISEKRTLLNSRLWCLTFVILPSFMLLSLFWISQEHSSAPIYFLRQNTAPVDKNNVNNILLSSQWIQYFPNLRKLLMIKQKEESASLYNRSTKAGNSELQLPNEGNFTAGRTLVARIQARDYLNENKEFGGDFFLATLRPDPHSTDGIICKVFDEMDGTYKVYCFLPWVGQAFLEVVMVHPSEAVYVLMKTYRFVQEPGVTMETTMVNSKKEKERTNCSIGYPGVHQSNICDYSNPKYGESWKCFKPPSGECSEIVWQDASRRRKEAYLPSPFFKPGINFETKIRGSGIELQIGKFTNESSLSEPFSPLFFKESKTTKPIGWSNHSKWTLFDREFIGYSTPRLRYCLRNKHLHFFGDSTMRQWFFHICNDLHLKTAGPDNSVAWSQPRHAESREMNLSLHYKGHGPPLHNPGPPSSHPYISNSLDEITEGGSNTAVIFGIGFHMELSDPDAYIDRLTRIKKSVVSLHQRLPDVKVFIKCLYGHAAFFRCPTTWTAYRLDVILHHVFSDLSYVTYLRLWDFMQLINQRDLHPDKNILSKQLGLVLMHIC